MNKMNLRPKAYDLLAKTLVYLATTLIAVSIAKAQDEAFAVEDLRESNQLVEFHQPIEVTAPYRERREDAGFMFSLGYENVILDRYISVIDFTTFYQDMFGESEFPVYELNLSYKYNFALGAITANTGIGYGSISDSGSGVERELKFIKYNASLSYIMDSLFEEPYVAPYVTGGLMRVELDETAGAVSERGAIDMLPFFSAGLLFQLNWMDPSVTKKNIIDYGLENTYLDVFVTKFEASSDSNDPDTSTDYSYGAGLRLEF